VPGCGYSAGVPEHPLHGVDGHAGFQRSVTIVRRGYCHGRAWTAFFIRSSVVCA